MRMSNLPQNISEETVLRMRAKMEDLTYQRFEEQGSPHLAFRMPGEKIDILQSLEYLSEFLNEDLIQGADRILIISDRDLEVVNGSMMEKKIEQKRSDDDDLFMELKYTDDVRKAEIPNDGAVVYVVFDDDYRKVLKITFDREVGETRSKMLVQPQVVKEEAPNGFQTPASRTGTPSPPKAPCPHVSVRTDYIRRQGDKNVLREASKNLEKLGYREDAHFSRHDVNQLFLLDHGGSSGNSSNTSPDKDVQGEPNYSIDVGTNKSDEHIVTTKIINPQNQKCLDKGQVVTKSFWALEAEAYYDDEFREDVESNLSAKYVSIITHACHSRGLIEDLNNANLNRLLISSCDESESSTIFGPLFNEWLNERCVDYPNPIFEQPQDDIKIYHADSNIQNEPGAPNGIIKFTHLGYDGKQDNLEVSLQEMFINSIYSSYVSEYYFRTIPNYFIPEELTGSNCYGQMYL